MTNHLTMYVDNLLLQDDEWQSGEIEITKTFDRRAGYSTDVEFFGRAYAYIKDKLVDNRVSTLNQTVPTPVGSVSFEVKTIVPVIVKIFDNCCGSRKLIFEGKVENITYDALRCTIKATLIEISPYLRVENYYINKSRFFDTKNLPKVGYCVEPTPNFIHDIIIVLTFIVKILVGAVLLSMRVILIVLEVIDFLLGALGIDVDISPVEFIERIFKEFNEFAFDCLKVHPAPYVRDILQDIAEQCGIVSVESDFFHNPASPYYNTVFFQAEVKEGYLREGNENRLGFIQENEPVYGASEFLDMLCSVFNANWLIIDKVLYIKHKSEWNNSEIIEFPSDVRTHEYTSREDINPAYAEVQFTLDGTDQRGNLSKNVWYKNILEFNNPPSNLQKGKKSYNIPFGMHRQVNDNIDRSVTWYWINDSVLSPLINVVFARDPSEVDGLLSLSNGTCMQPKLLVWDATRQRIADFNKAYRLREADGSDGALAKFFMSENPRTTGYKFFQYNIATEPLNCAEFERYTQSLGKRLSTVKGLAFINELRINYTRRTITFSGQI